MTRNIASSCGFLAEIIRPHWEATDFCSVCVSNIDTASLNSYTSPVFSTSFSILSDYLNLGLEKINSKIFYRKVSLLHFFLNKIKKKNTLTATCLQYSILMFEKKIK